MTVHEEIAPHRATWTGAPARVTGGVRTGLLFGACGYQIAYQVVTVLALRYLTDSLAVAAGLAATIFALTKFYDGLIDPAMGMWSDRTSSALGRRVPYLIAGTVLLPVATAAVFHLPHAPSALLIGAALLLWGTALTVWNVPFLALSVELSPSYHERTGLMAFRAYGSSIGLMLGSAIAPWLLARWGRSAAGHARMSLVMGALIFAMLAAATLLLRRARAAPSTPGDHRLFAQLATAWSNAPFRTLALVHVLFLLGVACSASSNAFFSRDVLRASDVWLGSFYVILLVGTLAATPLWGLAARRFDKRAAYLVSLVLYGLLNLSWLLAGPGEAYSVRVVRVLLIGAAMGGVVLMAYSTLSDAIRFDALRSGLRREGAFSGAMSLIDKVAGALGVAMMGYVLSAVGYHSTTTGGGELKSAAVLGGLYLNFAVIPAVTALLSAAVLLGYRLRESDLRGDTQ